MNNRPLTKMLACLTAKERNGFHTYLNCGLFNTNPTLIQLLSLLEKGVLKKANSKQSFESLTQDLAISSTTGEKLFSQLLSHLNDFIAIWDKKKTTPLSSASLDAWIQRGLAPELIDREYGKLKRKLLKMPTSNQTILQELELEHSYSTFTVNQPRTGKGEFFETHLQLLEHYFEVTQLKYFCAAISSGRVFKHEEWQTFNRISAEKAGQLPLIGQGYFAAFQLMQTEAPTAEDAVTFFHFLQSHGSTFELEELHDLFVYLLNSCFRSMAKRKPDFDALINQIYDEMLSKGLLTRRGLFVSGNFKNIVSIKMRLGLLQEAKTFIETYHSYLPEPEQKPFYLYTNGLVAFHSKAYRTAIQHFRDVIQHNPDDLFIGLESRNMLWKSYFEIYEGLSTDEHSEMHRLYHSFRVFVSRNSVISEYHKIGYENFIRIFNRLIHIGDQHLWASTKTELEALLQKTIEMEQVVNKKWLMQAIHSRIEKAET